MNLCCLLFAILFFVHFPKTTTASKCGVPKIKPDTDESRFKIVGGEEAVPYSWPWQAKVIIRLSYDSGELCGGVLIHRRWVLTAAHCINDTAISVRVSLGIHNQSQTDVFATYAKTFLHPQYDNSTIRNDIALLKLNTRVTFTDRIQRICVPRDDASLINGQKEAWATGWGRLQADGASSPSLQQAKLAIVQRSSKCSRLVYPFDSSVQICTFTPTGTSCMGDSGGPLMAYNPGRHKWFLVGISTMTTWTCTNQAVFTRVAAYCDWIENTIGVSVCKPKRNI